MFKPQSSLVNPIIEGMLAILYPKACLHCHRKIASEVIPLCTKCQQQLERARQRDVRARLHRLPAADGLFTNCFSLWTFDEGTILRSLQHAFKYQNLPTLGQSLGILIGQGYRQAAENIPDVIVPIPLHARRQLSRGYNQSLELAQGISAELDVPICTDLKRQESTQSQTKLNRNERWDNVRSAFQLIHPSGVQSRHVVLVDDVLTTGSTLAAAAQRLVPHTSSVSLATLGIART